MHIFEFCVALIEKKISLHLHFHLRLELYLVTNLWRASRNLYHFSIEHTLLSGDNDEQKFLQVALSIAASAWAMAEEDFTASYAYCSAATPSTTARIDTFQLGVLVIDITTILMAALLLLANRYVMRR